MGIRDAIVHAECDKCGEVSDALSLTPLARPGEWDERGVPAQLSRMEWHTENGKLLCPDCKASG